KSSSQRRQVFVDIQTAAGVEQALHLIKDMPVRWSSTKNMIERAYECREHIAQLVREMVRAEKDRKKRDALNELYISDEEWEQLKLFLELLELPDCAQQAFSAEKYSTLYNAIPALLSLCHAWEARTSNLRYVDLWQVLEPAIAKLNDYISDLRASPNDAYHLSMVLHPDIRLGPEFEACWPDSDERKRRTEAIERYIALNSQRKASTAATKPKKGSLRTLMAEFRPAVSSAQTSPAEEPASSEEWRVEYESYLRSDHDLPEAMPLVQWWGMMSTRYPTWASLAGDILAAMASSVSAERVFSSAGITITKRRNRLQGDIVEATQVLKAAIRNDLLVRVPQPSSTLE
ncbi:hypothetical protein EXIGLDRAFT_580196, partial [Exidia glandulosa HHB12029]